MDIDIEQININAAKAGDRVSIELILSEFCNNPHYCSPETRQYVADRIKEWFDLSCAKQKNGAPLNSDLVGKAFHLVAPSNRPKSEKVEQRHLEGWKVYLKVRMERRGHDVALEEGAEIACMTTRAFNKTRHLETAARLTLQMDGIKLPNKLPRKKRASNFKIN